MKEGAARAVLREVWLRGDRCVELQRDGKRTIFVCTRCGTRCYSDAALVDHLRGNLHARLSAATLTSYSSEKSSGTQAPSAQEEHTIVKRGWDRQPGSLDAQGGGPQAPPGVHNGGTKGRGQIVQAGSLGVAGPSKTSMEWIGSGELFFSVRSGSAVTVTPVVNSSWICWKAKGANENQSPAEALWQGGGQGGEIIYAVVMFPYSDMIGRGGDWKMWSSAEPKQARGYGVESDDRVLSPLPSPNAQTSSSPMQKGAKTRADSSPKMQTAVDHSASLVDVEKRKHALSREASGKVPRRACKRKKKRIMERLCFICHQKMTTGKDVAALLNLQTKQMVCGSRNKRGVFHVYHSSCLIDWISICELKTFTEQLDHRIDRTRKLTRTRRAIVEQSLNQGVFGDGGPLANNASAESSIFCPECQGTGLNLRGAQLERPRYRLAQVFDWILELIQARKAWADDRKDQQDTKRCGLLFRDEPQGQVLSRGVVHFYSTCAELLAGNALER